MINEVIDWEHVMNYIFCNDYTWTLESIQHQYEKYKINEYVSYTAKDVIKNSIIPQFEVEKL